MSTHRQDPIRRVVPMRVAKYGEFDRLMMGIIDCRPLMPGQSLANIFAHATQILMDGASCVREFGWRKSPERFLNQQFRLPAWSFSRPSPETLP